MNPRLDILLFSLIFVSCGVEAGNPGTSKPDPKKGSLTLRIATQLDSSIQSLNIKISSFDLTESGSENLVASIKPTLEEINLFSSVSDAEDLMVAKDERIPAGNYEKIIVKLANDRPIRFTNRQGIEEPIQFEESDEKSFELSDSFEIIADQSTDLVLTIDPYRSLEGEEQNASRKRYKFKPKGGFHRREKGKRFDGTTSIAEAEWVCSYAVRAPTEPNDIGVGDHKKELHDRPRRRPKVERGPIFETKESMSKDSTKDCPNAFAVAPVIEGKYSLSQLIPATYSLRFFKADGTFEDQSEDVPILPRKDSRPKP